MEQSIIQTHNWKTDLAMSIPTILTLFIWCYSQVNVVNKIIALATLWGASITSEASRISCSYDQVLLSISHIIHILDSEIKGIEREIDIIISACPVMNKNHDFLMNVVGIGKVMSRELMYLFSAKNFSTAKQAAAFVGLTPRLNESGSFKGRTTLSKIGPSQI